MVSVSFDVLAAQTAQAQGLSNRLCCGAAMAM
jgi:hypothetical protein